MANTNTIEDIFLSNSDTTGKGVTIGATASPGTSVHAQSGTASKDEVWLWCSNIHTADVKVTVQWGVASSSNNMEYNVPFDSGLFALIPGLTLTNTRSVRVFAAVASVINVFGHVNRITP